MTVSTHRPTWIAGQRCWVRVNIQNDSGKRVKSLNFALIRTITIFRPSPHLNATPVDVDIDACHTSTSRRNVAETILESGQKGVKGMVTGKGWWLGVEASEKSEMSHSIHIPVRNFIHIDWLQSNLIILGSLIL